MKKVNKIILFLFAIIIFAACNSSEDKEHSQVSQGSIPMEDGYLKGRVKEIKSGKDGYTAKIVTDENEVYFATISRANLKDNPMGYRDVEIDEFITFKGDVWEMGSETHVTVRELK